jgi:DinB family protein
MDFQALYFELVDSTEMIRALLAGVTPEQAKIRPGPDSWSILETICHLYDEEREDFRPRLDAILHQPPTPWSPIDPQGWAVSRKYNDRSLGEMKEKFIAERSKSLDWLKGLERADWETLYLTDFGEMRAGDMLCSWIAHDNLAVRQLVELRRARLETLTKPYEIGYAGDW